MTTRFFSGTVPTGTVPEPRYSPSLALAFLLVFTACSSPPDLYIFEGRTMGTTWSAKVVAQDIPDVEQKDLREALVAEIEEVDAKMSTYRDDSELSSLNAAAAGSAVELSPETLLVFQEAMEIARLTDGALDVTVGPLVNAWGFGPGRPTPDRAPEEIDRMLAVVGWDKISVGSSAVTKRVDGVYCDLSSVAKGYAVDRAAEAVERLGYSDYMVEIGGEVRASGANQEGRSWRIAIEKPGADGSSIQRVIPLADAAMATSGDYRNYWEEDGVRYSHTIDPRTGAPARHRLASVTVIDPTCLRADGFATALMVLGDESGLRLAEELELAALFQVRTDGGAIEEVVTPAFAKLMN